LFASDGLEVRGEIGARVKTVRHERKEEPSFQHYRGIVIEPFIVIVSVVVHSRRGERGEENRSTGGGSSFRIELGQMKRSGDALLSVRTVVESFIAARTC
jgi:hypothetical protein